MLTVGTYATLDGVRTAEFDFESLERILDARGETNLADLLGVSATALKEARLYGLDLATADRWAIRIGLHPSQIWPAYVDYDGWSQPSQPEVTGQMDLFSDQGIGAA